MATSIGFVNSTGVLRTISLADGVLRTVSDQVSFLSGGAWSGSEIIFARDSALWRIPQNRRSGKRTHDARCRRDEIAPRVADGSAGRRIVLVAVESDNRWRIDSLDLDSGERRTVMENGNSAAVRRVGIPRLFPRQPAVRRAF
jgi:hypothetical protein